MDWFLYDIGLRLERVKLIFCLQISMKVSFDSVIFDRDVQAFPKFPK